jgi:hypothetical protein
MSAQEQKLRESFGKLQKAGLKDLKFSFGPLAERTKEQVYGSVTNMLDAIIAGEVEPCPPIGDSYGLKKK